MQNTKFRIEWLIQHRFRQIEILRDNHRSTHETPNIGHGLRLRLRRQQNTNRLPALGNDHPLKFMASKLVKDA